MKVVLSPLEAIEIIRSTRKLLLSIYPIAHKSYLAHRGSIIDSRLITWQNRNGKYLQQTTVTNNVIENITYLNIELEYV